MSTTIMDLPWISIQLLYTLPDSDWTYSLSDTAACSAMRDRRLGETVVQIGVSLHLQNSTNKFQKLERKSEGHERLIHLVINCIAIKI